MALRHALLVLVVATLLLPGAIAAGGGGATTSAESSRTTGQWILNVTFVLLVAGAVATWWVVKRYEP